MPYFDDIEFNTRSFDELRRAFQINQIPNALLFYGKPDTRKKEAAFFFARGANCISAGQRPCGECLACRKIASGLHPDIHTVELLKGKKAVSISQIREMAGLLSTKPNEARTRVVVISSADRMNI